MKERGCTPKKRLHRNIFYLVLPPKLKAYFFMQFSYKEEKNNKCNENISTLKVAFD